MTIRVIRLLPGLVACAAIAALGQAAAAWPPLAHLGFGALTLAIALGIVVGNLLPGHWHAPTAAGASLCQRSLLRLGVALFGLHLTLQQVLAVGPDGVLTDVIVIAGVLALALLVGVRGLGLDRDTALLVATGSAICGAAAVMAAEPVVRAPPHKVAVAVATVTLFGTAAIFVYPLLYPWLGMDDAHYGIYVGSTVHEVAQVVAAAGSVSLASADQAVIVKLIRVLLLAPFLLLLARINGGASAAGARRTMVPGFVLAFVVVVAINSLGCLPASVRTVLLVADGWLLALAMAALGWNTRAAMLRDAGLRPIALGAALFAFLTGGGWAINRCVAWLI